MFDLSPYIQLGVAGLAVSGLIGLSVMSMKDRKDADIRNAAINEKMIEVLDNLKDHIRASTEQIRGVGDAVKEHRQWAANMADSIKDKISSM